MVVINDIEIYTQNLPITIEDVSKFVLFGREKLTSIRAEIRAIDKLQIAEEVRNQKKEEAQLLAEALLDAEVKLGELFQALHKDRSFRGNQWQKGSGEPLPKAQGFASNKSNIYNSGQHCTELNTNTLSDSSVNSFCQSDSSGDWIIVNKVDTKK